MQFILAQSAVADLIKSPAVLLVLGVIGLCAMLLPILWTIHLWKETFGKKPSVEEELKEKASKKELDEVRAENRAEIIKLREDAVARHAENSGRLARLESSSASNGTHLVRLETLVQVLTANDSNIQTKLDRLIERIPAKQA